jgi:hypothetical protein
MPIIVKADLAEALRKDLERLEQDKKNYGVTGRPLQA